MGFFDRRRNAPRNPDGEQNLTNYDERTVYNNAFVPPEANAQPQSVVPPPAMPAPAVPDYGTTAVMDAVTDERPMVFVSREHPGMYIYEFSDRLEYYMCATDRMHRVFTVKKV